MLKKFFPKRDIFFDFFEKQAAISYQAAQKLALFSEKKPNNDLLFDEIRKLEHEGDHVTHHCVEVLHKTFITPIDRMEIHRLITTLDNVIDEIEDVAKLVFIYKLPHFTRSASLLAQTLVSATKEVQSAVKEFKNMRVTATLQSHFYNINYLENEGDLIYIQGLGELFDEESDVKNLIKWKEVYDHLEEAIDTCEDVSNILEGIILENE